MSEEKKFTAREGVQTIVAEYISLAQKPQSGEKNGKTWTKCKATFKPDGRENEWKFVVWTPLVDKKSKYKELSELEPFKKYRIMWTEKDESYNGLEWVSKTIRCIIDENDDFELPNQSNGTVTQTKFNDSPRIPQEDDLVKFYDDFVDMYTNANKEINEKDFILTYLVNTYKELYVALKEYYASRQDMEEIPMD
jgi:hypothetical protein